MAPNLTVLSEVVDIRRDTPRAGDSFLIDTNVWLWMTYSKASLGPSPPRHYQASAYPTFCQAALRSGAHLLHCGLAIAELGHQIEKIEKHLYERSSGTVVSLKEFRHNCPTERAVVAAELQAAWSSVESMSSSLEIDVNAHNTAMAKNMFGVEKLDGYDLFMVLALQISGMNQVVTDDGDFSTVAGLRVFTANTNVLTAARNQSKLIMR
jgi:hypothetical protein